MANFCPECGTPTVQRENGGRDRDTCPACGWIQYAQTAIGIGALIVRGQMALLVERGIPPVGRWTIPSGYVEQDDTITTAVIREVQEETGLDCTPRGLICLRNIPKPHLNDVYLIFLCEVAPDAVAVPDGVESTQARFFHPDELDTIDPLSPFSRFVIEQYFAGRLKPWPLVGDVPEFATYPPDMVVYGAFE